MGLSQGGGGGGGGGAPTDAQYVTLAANGTLASERVLTGSTNISLTDAGAGAAVTLAVTGTIPSANLESHSGDVTGAHNATVVARVNGATYPAAGALVTGTIPRVTGVSTVAYGALDLANANARTGLLPIANLAAPDFGAQLVSSSTGYAAGSSPAASGEFRSSIGTAAADLLVVKTGASTSQAIFRCTANLKWRLGHETAFDGSIYFANLELWGYTALNFAAGSGGTNAMRLDGTNIRTCRPVAGSSTDSLPFRWKRAAISITAAGQTLTAAQYECPFHTLTSTLGAGTYEVVYPNQEGAFFCIENNATAELLKPVHVAAGAGATIATSNNAIIIHNGTRYIRMSADTVDGT